MINNKQRPTAEAIEHKAKEAFPFHEYESITTTVAKRQGYIKCYNDMYQIEHQPVSTGERLSAENILKSNTPENLIHTHTSTILSAMKQFAAHEVEAQTRQRQQDYSDLQNRNIELKSALISARHLIGSFRLNQPAPTQEVWEQIESALSTAAQQQEGGVDE